MTWQPIDSAPKDGTAILGYFGLTAGDEPPDMTVCRFTRKGWQECDLRADLVDEPTHWMHLPAPPEQLA